VIGALGISWSRLLIKALACSDSNCEGVWVGPRVCGLKIPLATLPSPGRLGEPRPECAIVNLSPDLSSIAKMLNVDQATVRTVLMSWGPGKVDAELFIDGKVFNGKKSAATLIPPAFGLAGVNLHPWIGWGSVTLLECLCCKSGNADPREPPGWAVGAPLRSLCRWRFHTQIVLLALGCQLLSQEFLYSRDFGIPLSQLFFGQEGSDVLSNRVLIGCNPSNKIFIRSVWMISLVLP
jgi:hypothetical protein